MSDVVRNYTGSGGRIKGRSIGARGSGCLGRIALGCVVLLLFVLWFTRNSYEATAFIPAGSRYNVVLSDPVNGLDRITASDVWNTWPDAASRDALLRKLRQDPGVPRWVLNNLLTQRLYLTGGDVRTFSDALAITHMSRIGTLLERLLVFGSGITGDYAGGLRMRHIEKSGIYYAVRGRILILSANRDVLVHSLTLQPGAALDDVERDNLLTEGAEDVRGTVQLAEDDPLGDAFESIAFAVRIDNDRAYAKCHATIRESARARFGPLLNGANPYALATPIPGMVEVSANFGKPVREVWASLGEALESSWLNASQWQAWEAPSADGAPRVAQTITSMLGPLGPSIRLSCTGFDQNEMVPVPILVGTLQVPAGAIPNLGALPPPPTGANPWDIYPRYNADKKLASVPLVGGPSLEPAALLAGRDLVFGTSRTAVEGFTQQGPATGELGEQANLFARVYPEPLVREGAAALRQLAEVGMLKGYDLGSFDTAARGWITSAARVKEVVLVAAGTDNAIDAELRIVCGETAVTSPTGTTQ
ncbi:MAG: hypothetical protein HUU46_20475 [Candidatus Hydrogenedentes bacterium]|nr:hypothetical protein [Candidatus Hydrogenedentota bacterium]